LQSLPVPCKANKHRTRPYTTAYDSTRPPIQAYDEPRAGSSPAPYRTRRVRAEGPQCTAETRRSAPRDEEEDEKEQGGCERNGAAGRRLEGRGRWQKAKCGERLRLMIWLVRSNLYMPAAPDLS
jgi:hypothetical protein